MPFIFFPGIRWHLFCVTTFKLQLIQLFFTFSNYFSFSLNLLWNLICDKNLFCIKTFTYLSSEIVVPINWPSSTNITSIDLFSSLAALTFQISWAISGCSEHIRVKWTLLRIRFDTGVSCADCKFLLQKWLQCWSQAYIMFWNKMENSLIGNPNTGLIVNCLHFCRTGKYVFRKQHKSKLSSLMFTADFIFFLIEIMLEGYFYTSIYQ